MARSYKLRTAARQARRHPQAIQPPLAGEAFLVLKRERGRSTAMHGRASSPGTPGMVVEQQQARQGHRHGSPAGRGRPPSLDGLGAVILDGAEKLDGAVEGIGICPHGDLGGDGALLVETQGGAEVVHGRVLIVVGLLGIGGGKEGIDELHVKDTLEDGGIRETDVVLHAFHALGVGDILEPILIDAEELDAGADGAGNVSLLVEEEDVIVDGDLLGLVRALGVVPAGHAIESEDIVMDVGDGVGIGAHPVAHVLEIRSTGPGEEDGIVGELIVERLRLGAAAADIGGDDAAADEDVVENADLAHAVLDIQGDVAAVEEQAVLDGQLTVIIYALKPTGKDWQLTIFCTLYLRFVQ